MRALIVGFGSIGKRHHKNLVSLGCREIDIFDPRAVSDDIQIHSEINSLKEEYDFIFICSPNINHLDSVKAFRNHSECFFIEKPVSPNGREFEEFKTLLEGSRVMVGCNYRFEKGLNLLKDRLEASGETVQEVRAEYGHYLPQWRKTPYQESYSAHKDQGGGIALDRIHEFDYLQWLFGKFEIIGGQVENTGALDIDVEDNLDLDLKFKGGVQGHLHLDYLQKRYKCELRVKTNEGEYTWTYLPSALKFQDDNGTGEILFNENQDVNEMYLSQTKKFLEIYKSGDHFPNGLDEAFELVRKINDAKEKYAN